eukprot:TRINITY_DN28196_c0_g1_i1.p1 TRINITY_DN28196_c0_g1~~TRINITY_DN28196_c0_g1_i1.p1  ORF type:complete len:155 (-),score=16.54 TRINITY_DN28196_c0_g1_i1:184-597(-)
MAFVNAPLCPPAAGSSASKSSASERSSSSDGSSSSGQRRCPKLQQVKQAWAAVKGRVRSSLVCPPEVQRSSKSDAAACDGQASKRSQRMREYEPGPYMARGTCLGNLGVLDGGLFSEAGPYIARSFRGVGSLTSHSL